MLLSQIELPMRVGIDLSFNFLEVKNLIHSISSLMPISLAESIKNNTSWVKPFYNKVSYYFPIFSMASFPTSILSLIVSIIISNCCFSFCKEEISRRIKDAKCFQTDLEIII